MNTNDKIDRQTLIAQLIAKSNDGYAVFDQTDVLIYCNDSYANLLLSTTADKLLNKSFAQSVGDAFLEKRNISINSSNIDEWLAMAQSKRWQTPFRSFETDLNSSHWLLITELVFEDRFLFVTATDITRTKTLELKLKATQDLLYAQANQDELTGLANRRAFVERGTRSVAKAHRNYANLSLFLFDIDHFKNVNDQYGHLAGDSVLKSLSQVVQSQLRNYDLCARIGGEEFVILFVDGSPQKNLTIIERIRNEIEQTVFEFEQIPIRIKVSFGGTCLSAEDTLDTLLSRADKNLYLAKNQGRNQVCFCE